MHCVVCDWLINWQWIKSLKSQSGFYLPTTLWALGVCKGFTDQSDISSRTAWTWAKVCAFVRLLWHRPTDCLSVLIHQWACRDTGYTVSISPRLLWHRPIDYLMMRSVLIHQWACRDIGYSRAVICPLYMFRLRSSTATLRCSRILVRQVEARGN